MLGSSFSHSGSTSHSPVHISQWWKDSCDCIGVMPAGLLHLDTVQHLIIQPQQSTVCAEHPSVYSHGDQETLLHHTGVSQSSLAPCYCPHSVQNSESHYWHSGHSLPIRRVTLTFMTYSICTARHDNSGPPVATCLKFRGWYRFCSTQLHLLCSAHLEQYLTTSLATWMSLQTLLKRSSKRFVTLTATRRSTWPPRLRFVILMTNTWCIKCCIMTITIISNVLV